MSTAQRSATPRAREILHAAATLTLVLLATVGVLQVVAPLALVAALRERLRSMEERLFLHSHHLRTLAVSYRADTRS